MEVPHAHIHLIPLDKESDASFNQPKLKLSEQEFEETAEKIRSAL
jgi:histidine triad (HIT) family protein